MGRTSFLDRSAVHAGINGLSSGKYFKEREFVRFWQDIQRHFIRAGKQ
jgi:hypothetical protein